MRSPCVSVRYRTTHPCSAAYLRSTDSGGGNSLLIASRRLLEVVEPAQHKH